MNRTLSMIILTTLVVSFIFGVMSSPTMAYVELQKKDGGGGEGLICYESPISITLVQICCSDPNGDWHCAVFRITDIKGIPRLQ